MGSPRAAEPFAACCERAARAGVAPAV